MALAYETRVAFSSTIQSQKPYNSIIINCYAKAESVLSKVISEKEVAVFGEYSVLVFYRQPNATKEANYKSFTLRKNFCEIVLFDTLENSKIESELKLQPSCKFNYVSKSRIRSFWNIEVSGEIRVSSIACDTESDIDATETVDTAKNNTPKASKNALNNISAVKTANSSNDIGTVDLSHIVNSDNDTTNIVAGSNNANTINDKSTTNNAEQIQETDNTDSVRKEFTASSQKNFEYNISSKVWQFEDSESTNVEELMYMDFEVLKNLDKD
ncbi:hypothetical protein EHE19_018750 [Ruminiclostridium herbifermentans]|uniref:Uncharacterized protein n=1 Tax=Ruminiclostridium herbifermentans TaxID=2488810 RepID=A0A4U7JDA7_9FIRM|nr:hypothetical protein [Ruminiclostridium herbifermentans]QNU66839.1 hypothetical protein EHE19_018750 [Ruminiclostridium herbifermentans]